MDNAKVGRAGQVLLKLFDSYTIALSYSLKIGCRKRIRGDAIRYTLLIDGQSFVPKAPEGPCEYIQ